MNPTSKSFTVEFFGKVNQIITHCGISKPYDPLKTSKPPEIVSVRGLWDTGATNTVITGKLARDLGLVSTGMTKSFHANGVADVPTYYVNIYLPNQVGFQFVKVTEGVLAGFDILIGMDIIGSGDFALTSSDGKTTFSFRYPSESKIDFVAENNIKPQPVLKGSEAIGRNSKCHCGSGKKYKNCCGK